MSRDDVLARATNRSARSASPTESAVRQWLRERAGMAHCAGCLSATFTREEDVALIVAAVTTLAKRPPFVSGRCP